ncbi:hypothetical protein [Paenibacillus sp. KS-LC4]|uniref:hypothetical protein n=1 Tax=Paenibacillus sp. KS-LC4 TaxID=2979727 RepID=UPI0030D6198C
MADALKGIVVVILLVFAFIIYPAYRQSENVEEEIKQRANAATIEFVDTVRSKGYVDLYDYKIFLSSLDASYGVFEVQLEYYKKNLQPNYTDPNDFSTFQNSFNVRYDGYYTKEILNRLYGNSALAEDDPNRRFNMFVGDLFNVRLSLKGTTLASNFRTFLFKSQNVPINIKYGGMVRNEAP